jgi:hypothetical protein
MMFVFILGTSVKQEKLMLKHNYSRWQSDIKHLRQQIKAMFALYRIS